MTESRKVYLDYSATTPVRDEVLKEMLPYFTEHFGNASSLYTIGLESKAAIDKAREQVANLIGASPKEIYFTGGGSESDNWVLESIANDMKSKGKGNHIITSRIEHHAVLHTCQFLEKNGYEVTYLDVEKDGTVTPEALEKAIRDDTVLISIMYINNEIGTIEPIRELAEVAHKHGILFHTDAVQAVGNTPIDVKAAGIDLVHFGIVCNVNIMIGGLTPPFGSMMFTCVSITGCKMQEFIKECVPFIIALLLALLLLTYIPGITMLIPNLIY